MGQEKKKKYATKEEANKVLEVRLIEARRVIKECRDLADEYGLQFESPIPEYGMGGTYYGENMTEEWAESNKGKWMPSSQSC